MDSLSLYLFLFNFFFFSRSASPINHLLFVMADFRIHIVDEIGVVRFAEYKGEGVCHLHQFTISGVSAMREAFNAPFTIPVRSMVRWAVNVCTLVFAELNSATKLCNPRVVTCSVYLVERSLMKLVSKPVS